MEIKEVSSEKPFQAEDSPFGYKLASSSSDHFFDRAYDPDEQVNVSEAIGEEDDDYDAIEDGSANFHRDMPKFSWRKLLAFTGPGILMSIAYLDPGNLESDLQSGAQGGHALLWILMWATIMGLLVQLLAARVGVASGLHLAELCRKHYPRPVSHALWILTEVAICGSDIQEVIGSAIAIRILSNGLIPLWCGVLITATDGFVFLFLEKFGVRKLEALFTGFVAVMVVAFARMFVMTDPDYAKIASGLLIPSVPQSAVSVAVGIVGAVIMPHNIFLHSALVQSRAINTQHYFKVKEAIRYYTIESSAALFVSFVINLMVVAVFAKVFYGTEVAFDIGLVNAGEYLQTAFGSATFPVQYIWAIGLLAAGQSSTMTGTYAGQFVMAGFLQLRVKKWVRVVITRCFAIVPTVIVALMFDQSDNQLDRLNEWLNVLQSVQLPFATLPLLHMVIRRDVMGEFTIGSSVLALSSAVVILVVGINMYLLFHVVTVLLPQTSTSFISLGILGAIYFVFIVYLAVGPTYVQKIQSAVSLWFSSRDVHDEGKLVEEKYNTNSKD